METLAKFLGRLQSSDEVTKRRALIVGVTLVMAVVLVVWLRYFNTLLVTAPPVPSGCCATDEIGSFSPLQTVKEVVRAGARGVYAQVERVMSFIQSPAAYVVTPTP